MGKASRELPFLTPGRRRAALLASTSFAAALIAAPQVRAQQVLPTHGAVASGAATIRQSGPAITINQASSRAVINWDSFSIGAGNSVTFAQPDAGSATLNRVTGATPTSIAGRLSANGQVYLVNPNGIAITKNGAVSVGGGFVGSTLDITDHDFNQGRLVFSGGGASAAVSNAGTITAAPGGFVSLLGGSVSNSGTIDAPLGKVALGAGEQATLDLSGDGFLQVALPTDAKTADGKALVDVSGTVKAAGGTVAIKAATAANAVRNAINLSGYVSARSARQVGGSIVLGGGEGGDVKISGRLDASGHRGGGSLAVSGRNVALKNARLTVRSAAGVGGAVAVTGTGVVKLVHARLDASGAAGGGAIAVGGNPRGVGPLAEATKTSVENSVIVADALTRGNGGAITVWSNGETIVAGRLSARGGALSGDGGTIETSGKTAQLGGAHVDTTAPHGAIGEWVIDPNDFIIGAGGDITGAQLSTNLASTDVTILSSNGAGGVSGDVVVNDPVSWSSGSKLTLDAAADIVINANMMIGGAGKLALITGDTAQNGTGSAAGALQFAMSDTGPGASVSFTGAGSLSLNGAAFTLLRAEADLAQLNVTPGGNFALAGDINLPTSHATNVVPDFYGHLEGLGHSLKNLTLTAGGASVGFIGILDAAGSGTAAAPPTGASGVVSNLFLANVNIDGGANDRVGALAGENFGHVYNSGSSGTVKGTGSDIGGLVGFNNGFVEFGYSSAAVTGSATAGSGIGGLVGENAGGVIGGLASGDVAGFDSVGGLVGLNYGYINSGAAGSVSGSTSVGGIVGQNAVAEGDFTFQNVDYGANGLVAGAYGYGSVTSGTDAGGVVGYNLGTVDTSFFNGPVSGAAEVGGLVGLNAGAITSSYAIGPVTATGTAAGGLVGRNTGSIDSSFAMGAVNGVNGVGGLVGQEDSQRTETSVTNSFSTGVVSGTTGVGGLIGALLGGGEDDTVANAYWDTTTSGLATSAAGAGHTTAELQGGAALALGTNFSGGATGGETAVYPYLNQGNLFPNGVHAVSGFAYKDAAGTVPLASGAAGAALVYVDTEGSVKNPASTGVNGYYYSFFQPTALPAGADLVAYTIQNPTIGATNAATYLLATGANNQTGVNILGSTFSETTALPTYSQLVQAVANATATDDQTPGALGGVNFISITSTGTDFRVDQAISTPAALSITGATTLAANVTATGGVRFNSPVALASTITVDSGTAGTNFAASVTGAATGAGLTVNGPVTLGGDVTTNDGALAFNGPVIVNADLTINSGNAPTSFGSTIDSGVLSGQAFSLTVNAGALSFGGAIGDGPFSAVSLTSAASMTLPSVLAHTIFARTTAGGANLTLAPGAVLSASGAGTAVTLATAGAFINDAGAGAIALPSTGANWLIYSNNPTADTFGGLDSGNFAVWNTAFPSTAPPTSGNTYLFAYQPTVTLTSINDAKSYGQDVSARVANDFAVTGLQPAAPGAYLADTAARAYSGAPVVTSAGSTANAPVAGSPYAIDIAQGSLAALNGYALALVSAGQLSVSRAAVTITAAPDTKTYDATTAAAAAPTVTTGALADAATLTETYATPNAGSGLTLTPQIAFANSGVADNYLITLTSAPTGTINPEPITVTATPNAKFFDGNVSAAALPQLTAGTLFDAATLSETYASPGPGPAISLTPAIAFANPNAGGNYQITLVPTGVTPPNTGTILSITPVNLSPSVFVDRRPDIGIPGAASTCGVDLQLPEVSTFSDPAAAILAISAATSQYVERCRDASQEDIANALDRYADALEIVIQKLPPKLRAQLRHIPAMVRAAAVRARAAPTRAAAVRVLQQTVAQVHREIMLVRAEDPDSARIRSAVNSGVSGVLNSAAVALARAEGI